MHVTSWQVLSNGLTHAAVGAGGYWSCINTYHHPDEYTYVYDNETLVGMIEPGDGCDTSIAARYPLFFWVIGTWLGTTLLVWCALGLLIAVKQRDLVASPNQDDKVVQRKALSDASVERRRWHLARVQKVLCYDVVCHLLCGVFVMFFVYDDLTAWELRQLLFWAKTICGLLALPYLFLSLPLMHLLFNTSPATGYTRMGQCRKMLKEPPQSDAPIMASATRNPMLDADAGD